MKTKIKEISKTKISMNKYLEAFLTTLVILTYPIPFLVTIRFIRGWNEITYVKDIFSNQYYLFDSDYKLGSTAFAPVVSHIILFDEIICFIFSCVKHFMKKPIEILSHIFEMIGNIRLK